MTLEEALREAHNRCPLAHIKTFIDGKPQSCGWQGHAAIDLVAKVAALEQAEADAHRKSIEIGEVPKGLSELTYSVGFAAGVDAFRQSIREERDRLRREAACK